MNSDGCDVQMLGGPLDGVSARVTTRLCACCQQEFMTVALPLSCADAVSINEALQRYVYDQVLQRMTWPGGE